jgi:hypothetical protein
MPFAGEMGGDGVVFGRGVLVEGASLDWIGTVGSGAEVGGRFVDEMLGEGLAIESDAELDWNVLELASTFTLVLRTGANIVVLSGIDVLIGNRHGGVAAVHWDWQEAMASPVPAQLHVPVVPHPSTVPGSGSHGQQLEQHHRHSGLSQPQPLAHPMKLLPVGYVASRRRLPELYELFIKKPEGKNENHPNAEVH